MTPVPECVSPVPARARAVRLSDTPRAAQHCSDDLVQQSTGVSRRRFHGPMDLVESGGKPLPFGMVVSIWFNFWIHDVSLWVVVSFALC